MIIRARGCARRGRLVVLGVACAGILIGGAAGRAGEAGPLDGGPTIVLEPRIGPPMECGFDECWDWSYCSDYPNGCSGITATGSIFRTEDQGNSICKLDARLLRSIESVTALVEDTSKPPNLVPKPVTRVEFSESGLEIAAQLVAGKLRWTVEEDDYHTCGSGQFVHGDLVTMPRPAIDNVKKLLFALP